MNITLLLCHTHLDRCGRKVKSGSYISRVFVA